jgi:hypothetical protein
MINTVWLLKDSDITIHRARGRASDNIHLPSRIQHTGLLNIREILLRRYYRKEGWFSSLPHGCTKLFVITQRMIRHVAIPITTPAITPIPKLTISITLSPISLIHTSHLLPLHSRNRLICDDTLFEEIHAGKRGVVCVQPHARALSPIVYASISFQTYRLFSSRQ